MTPIDHADMMNSTDDHELGGHAHLVPQRPRIPADGACLL